MAFDFAKSGTLKSTASGSTITPALPALTGAPNIRYDGALLAFAIAKNNAVISTATVGWVKLRQDNSGAAFTQAVFIAPIGSANPVFTWTGSAANAAQVLYYEDPNNPIVTNAVGASSASAGTASPLSSTSINTTRAVSRVVRICSLASIGNITDTSGWAQDDSTGGSGGVRTAIYSKGVYTAGDPSGGGPGTYTGTSAAWIQTQVELLIAPQVAGVQTTAVELGAWTLPANGIVAAPVEFGAWTLPANGIVAAPVEFGAWITVREGRTRRRRMVLG